MLVLGLASLFGVAQTLSLDYFDAFQYLKNARILAEIGGGGVEFDYAWNRPPAVPLVHALFYPVGAGAEGALAAFHAAHLRAWAFGVLALCAVYWLYARETEPVWALLGVVLVAAAPCFLHLVPFALVDVPAMLFTALALGSYLSARESGSTVGAVGCGVALAAAISTKYNLLLLIPCLLLFEGLTSLLAGRNPFRAIFSTRVLVTFGTGIVGWLLVHFAVRVHLEGLSFGALTAILETTVHELGLVNAPGSRGAWPGLYGDDPTTEYVEELVQITPALLGGAGVVGLVLTLRERRPADLLHGIWFVVFLSVMTFGITTKTSRYLLPVLPSLVHLELRGLLFMRDWLGRQASSRFAEARTARIALSAATVAGAALVLWLPLSLGIEQLRHFDDPVYRTPFVEELFRAVDDALEPPSGTAGDEPVEILWRGPLHAIHPDDPVFFPHDETFAFYHVGARALEYFLNRRVGSWNYQKDLAAVALVEDFAASSVVVTSTGKLRMTHLVSTFPKSRDPMWVDRVERRTYVQSPRDALRFEDTRGLAPALVLKQTEGGLALRDALPTRGWRTFFRAESDGAVAPLASLSLAPPFALELVRVTRRELRYGE